MSTLVVSYHDLEDAAKDARKAAALLEEYGETIEEKICKKLKEYSGSWTSNIDVADQLMRDKLVQLRQKQEDFETLASNIETFKNNCVTADNNVKVAIESLSGDFKNTYGIKENIVTKWFNYIGTEIGNSSALGRYLKDIGNTIEVAVTDGIENIKDWYKYEGGKYIIDDIVTVALVTLEVVGAVVAIASGVGAIVAIATVIATTMTVANGLTSIYNNSKAYNAMQNENPAWAMRYAGRDTLTEQMRETSDSKFVHNLATGLDVLETSAGLIVKQFWNQERERILAGQNPTRNWSQEQLNDILQGNVPKYNGKPIQGHHTYSASKYPHLSNEGEVIYPVTKNEHLQGWHGGNYKKSLPGEPIVEIIDFE
ncbi:HNH/endonuclease VII toxin of polymorphic toxin system [Mobilisporobacter senegalensis]|uniref:HNH/endonuclease VII toxin of polymorphic toxin system n=1 Tax=Mobilisporobacter senegalensis TaxID=1329262 RepID=A0A3N1XXW8_9FIRM|nr:hypothetical protein [Mobilisporobacter senegalensis]ROR31430.1 HNH/endonuclease VII toxin of polymorphic toxin system [Mobilisporobacter senegalensis]